MKILCFYPGEMYTTKSALLIFMNMLDRIICRIRNSDPSSIKILTNCVLFIAFHPNIPRTQRQKKCWKYVKLVFYNMYFGLLFQDLLALHRHSKHVFFTPPEKLSLKKNIMYLNLKACDSFDCFI